jgi:hypothetical protein
MHEACARVSLPRCAVCAAPLEGTYLVDAWGEGYCPAHASRLPACPFCAGLMTRGGAPAGDPTPRCERCLAAAVSTAPEARVGFDRAREWLRRQGLATSGVDLQFRLVDRQELRSGPQPIDGLCFGRTKAARGPARPPAITVMIARGLPRTVYAGTCVHELGHVWLRQRGIDTLPAWDEEGFCELLSWRYFAALGTREGRYHCRGIEESAHPVYGEGFRRVRALCQQYSFPHLVNDLARHKRLPGVYSHG